MCQGPFENLKELKLHSLWLFKAGKVHEAESSFSPLRFNGNGCEIFKRGSAFCETRIFCWVWSDLLRRHPIVTKYEIQNQNPD